MRFGMHLSMNDGPARGQEIGCRSLQIFVGNPRGWGKNVLDPKRVAKFRAGVAEAGIDPVVVHATYLINLAAPDAKLYKLSVDKFLDELRKAAQVGAAYYVVHSGSHKGQGDEAGRERIVEAIRRADEEVPERPEILLENTAGTSNSLGTTFGDLALLLDGAHVPRTGVCFDTCHALAAGYEIRTPQGAKQVLDEFDRVLGIGRLKVLHVNDSKGQLGSRLDRHEHIGRGAIGDEGFRSFFADTRLWRLPAILETPQDADEADRADLWKAIELAVSVGALDREALEAMPTGPHTPVKTASKAAVPAQKAKRAPKARRLGSSAKRSGLRWGVGKGKRASKKSRKK